MHDARLLEVLDGRLSSLPQETFEEMLPLLRRAFSRFESGERVAVGRAVSRAEVERRRASGPLDTGRAREAQLAVLRILGDGDD